MFLDQGMNSFMDGIPNVLLLLLIIAVLYLIDNYLGLDLKGVVCLLFCLCVVFQRKDYHSGVQIEDLKKNLINKIQEIEVLETLRAETSKLINNAGNEKLNIFQSCLENTTLLKTEIKELQNEKKLHREKIKQHGDDLKFTKGLHEHCKNEFDDMKEKWFNHHNNKNEDTVSLKVNEKICNHKLQESEKKLKEVNELNTALKSKLDVCETDVDPMKTLLIQVEKNSQMMDQCSKQKPSLKREETRGGFFSNGKITTEESTTSPHCETIAKEYTKIFDGIARLVGPRHKEIGEDDSKQND